MTAKVRDVTYDPHCYDLAEQFLSDEPRLNTQQKREDLARAIQTAIESWFAFEEGLIP